jgi:hypothetical protein
MQGARSVGNHPIRIDQLRPSRAAQFLRTPCCASLVRTLFASGRVVARSEVGGHSLDRAEQRLTDERRRLLGSSEDVGVAAARALSAAQGAFFEVSQEHLEVRALVGAQRQERGAQLVHVRELRAPDHAGR